MLNSLFLQISTSLKYNGNYLYIILTNDHVIDGGVRFYSTLVDSALDIGVSVLTPRCAPLVSYDPIIQSTERVCSVANECRAVIRLRLTVTIGVGEDAIAIYKRSDF